MAFSTNALRVAFVISGATILDRDDVVHDLGSDQQATCFAQPAQGVRAQQGRTQGTPGGGLVEAEFGIEAAAGATVVAVLSGTVRVAVAGGGQHRTATRVPAGRRGTQGHSHLSGGEDLAS